jgi:hypothetical protein
MIRRISAALGILVLLVMVAALIWAVHRHREQMRNPPGETELVSENRPPTLIKEGVQK